MKKIIIILMLICIGITLTACGGNNSGGGGYVPPVNAPSKEQIYSFDVQAIVTDIQIVELNTAQEWGYDVTITVYCEELNLTKSFTENLRGTEYNSVFMDLKINDIITIVAKKKVAYGQVQDVWLDRVGSVETGGY